MTTPPGPPTASPHPDPESFSLPAKRTLGRSVFVKICGVTRVEDAVLAARLGADAVGLNFWVGSKRYIAPEAARAIVAALPPHVAAFGVFVDATREEVERAADTSGIGLVQLHGDESPEFVASLTLPVVKAIRVADRTALDAVRRFTASAFLLDAPSAGYGGSGERFDWTIAAEAACTARILLAGGLTPENVAGAVRAVRPYGVDVASGVERAPGIKDEAKVSAFIRAAKAAAEEQTT